MTGRALPALLLLGRTAVARPPARRGAGRRGRRRGAAVELAGRPEAAVQRHEGVAAPGVEAEGAVAPSRPRVHELDEGGRGEAVVRRPEVHGEANQEVSSAIFKSELKPRSLEQLQEMLLLR